MNISRKLDHSFPFYLNDDRKNLWFIAAVSMLVFVFMLLFETSSAHHLELTTFEKAIFAVVTFVSLSLSIVILPKVFTHLFDPIHWTVRKYILHTLFNVVVISLMSTTIDELYICPERSLWENFIGATQQVGMIGTVPVSLMTLFLRNRMLRDNLNNAMLANQELQRIKDLKGETPSLKSNQQPVTLLSDTTEKLTINLSDLLFIQADHNYCTIFWRGADKAQKKLLRVNLKSLSEQINNPYAIRCHRSFIVNVNAIRSITGNANGYKLQVVQCEQLIPVSRQNGKDIIEKIQQIRNIMELAD